MSLLAALVAGAVAYLVTPRVIGFNRSRGLVGRDVHKPGRPEVAEAGGVALAAGLIAASPLLLADPGLESAKTAGFLLATLYAFTVGLLDDVRWLDAKTKPLLTALAAVPLLLLGAYNPRPVLPFIGPTRLTIVYPFALPLFMAVMCNAANMSDTHNGVLPITGLAASSALVLAGLYAYRRGAVGPEAYILPLVLVGLLAGYYPYNRYPARVFNGDSGSFLVGAALVSAAVAGGLEVVAVVAVMPYILNGFEIIFSVGGLVERREMRARPVLFDEERCLMRANPDRGAPITVVSLLAAREPVSEKDVVEAYKVLAAFSAAAALVTALLTF